MSWDVRRKNVNWQLPVVNNSTGAISNDDAHLAVLMDIRDELQSLNKLFGCYNFQSIPRELRKLVYNSKPRRLTRKQLEKQVESLKKKGLW